MIIYYISDAVRSRFSAGDDPRFFKERASANDRDWIDSPGERASAHKTVTWREYRDSSVANIFVYNNLLKSNNIVNH